MKVNLTDYISTFAAFDPTFDAIKSNPLVKVKNCYQTTKSFLASLEKFSLIFPQLKEIRAKLADLNEFFADMLLEQTNGTLQLAEGANLQVAKSRNKLSHALAKKIIQDPDELLELIEEFLEDIKKQASQSKQVTLDEKKKLDDVDLNLLTHSMISLGFQDRFFGGVTNINAKTQRSNESLFVNKDFSNLAASTTKIQDQDELLNIASTLQQFRDRTNVIENKFGFMQEESTSFTPAL